MTRKQAGGRLPATTALHDEEAGNTGDPDVMLGRCTSDGTCYTSLTRSVGTVTAHFGCWFTDPSRRLEAGIECIDEPGRETCLCDGNLCNLFLPALRETQPQLEYWHALILLVPVLLVLLALGATAFWAIRRRRRGQ